MMEKYKIKLNTIYNLIFIFNYLKKRLGILYHILLPNTKNSCI